MNILKAIQYPYSSTKDKGPNGRLFGFILAVSQVEINLAKEQRFGYIVDGSLHQIESKFILLIIIKLLQSCTVPVGFCLNKSLKMHKSH